MRNAVVHSLAPFPELVETCWISQASLDERGTIRDWELRPFYAKGALDQKDALPWTLYRWALETAEEAYDLLVELCEELAGLIEDLGEIAPPPAVYVTNAGAALLELPGKAQEASDGAAT